MSARNRCPCGPENSDLRRFVSLDHVDLMPAPGPLQNRSTSRVERRVQFRVIDRSIPA
jgi:hypothetical protein